MVMKKLSPKRKRTFVPAHPLKDFDAVAAIVDINGFTRMIQIGDPTQAQFVRDVLGGAVGAIEECGGEVVGLMGDAVLGVLRDARAFAEAAILIAKDTDRTCQYLSGIQRRNPEAHGFAPGGPSLKVTAEYGRLDSSTIRSRFLGEQRLLVGEAINYAARIGVVGRGNRCHVGPVLASMLRESGFSKSLSRSQKTPSKNEIEGTYRYYTFDLGDIWMAGSRGKRGSYWG